MKWLNGIISSMEMSLSKPRKIVKDSEACCTAAHGVAKLDMTERLTTDMTLPIPLLGPQQ